MRTGDLVRLASLAAIWGATFIFIRVTAPVLGPVWTTEGRLLIGGLALLAWFRFTGFEPQWRRHIRFYAITGLLATAIPFTLYGFAGMHISASLMAVLNTTAPMFAVVLGAAFGMERISRNKVAGLLLGTVGVVLVTQPAGVVPGTETDPMSLWAVAACLSAAFAYALTGLWVKGWGSGIPSRGTAVGAQICAAIMLLPLLPLLPPLSTPSAVVTANLVALGIVGSAIAYILYFRLIADVGAVRAQTVALLIPVFGMLWGALFLDETLGWTGMGGAALILLGTLLIMRGS